MDVVSKEPARVRHALVGPTQLWELLRASAQGHRCRLPAAAARTRQLHSGGCGARVSREAVCCVGQGTGLCVRGALEKAVSTGPVHLTPSFPPRPGVPSLCGWARASSRGGGFPWPRCLSGGGEEMPRTCSSQTPVSGQVVRAPASLRSSHAFGRGSDEACLLPDTQPFALVAFWAVSRRGHA